MTNSSTLHNPFPDELVITHLVMARAAFRPAYIERADLTIVRLGRVDVPYYRFLYGTVGDAWRWRDRLIMPDDELAAILSDPANAVYVLHLAGVPAGYVEVEVRGETGKIAYLGLRPGFIGMGLGRHLLSFGVARAFDAPIERVIVNTNNLDAPSALDNYLKRGFSVERVERLPMPDRYRP
jgi:ribosomal protein S18 acetylase RimI-like enzyme